MSTQPLGTPKFRAFDSNGDPLSGGLLYTYAAGTTTPLATYTTRAGDVANANPVALDANGEADVWMTPGVDYKFVLKTSGGVTLWTVDNFPSPSDQNSSDENVAIEPGGRLTLTDGTPVTTSNVTGATTVFYEPFRHSKLAIYNGSEWELFSIGDGLSQTTTDNTKSPAAVANNSNYDLFVWDDSGIVRLSRGPAWSSDTSRGTGAGTTELERVDGRYVNKVSIANGPAAQRGLYVGTIRSDGSAQVNDSLAKRHVWNMYNRVSRPMRVTDATASWVYSSTTIRQANGNASNQLDIVRGLDEDAVRARVDAMVDPSADSKSPIVAVGLDSTTAYASGVLLFPPDASLTEVTSCIWNGYPGLGRHTLVWLEHNGGSANTSTWIGTVSGGSLNGQTLSGITADVLA